VLRVASGQELRAPSTSLERRLRSGTVIEIFVTAPGRIGKYARITIRSNAAPARRDLCLNPGKSTPVAVPEDELVVLAAQLGEQELRVHRADEVA
jgi:hypothetical protein